MSPAANTLLLLCTFNNDNISTMTATWNGNSMTKDTSKSDAGSLFGYLFSIYEAAGGTHNFVVSSSSTDIWLRAVSLTNMKNAAPEAVSNAAGSGTTTTATITTLTADSVHIAFMLSEGGAGSPGGGTQDLVGTTKNLWGGSPLNKASPGSSSLTATGSSGPWCVGSGAYLAQTTTTYNQDVIATTAVSGTMTQLKTILQAITATPAVSASIATVKNAVAELIATATMSASVLKQMTMSLTATTAVSADILAQRVFLQALDAITAISASVETSISKLLAATTAVSASVDKTFSVSQLISATTNITASIEATRGVVLEAIAAVSASMTTAIGKTLVATITIIGKVSAPFYRTKYPSHEDASDYEVKYPHD